MAGDDDDRDDDARERSGAGPEVWDRFGSYLGYAGAIGTTVSKRTIGSWNQISRNLRSSDGYKADDMAGDAALLMATAMDNLQDFWGLFTTNPDDRVIAGPVPTAFLVFQRGVKAGEYALADVRYVLVPPDIDSPPRHARFALNGPTKDDADNLSGALTATLDAKQRAYEITARKADKALTPGAYSGLVYLRMGSRDVPLADLRILVEEPPRARSGR
ncbi:hypothetical protein OM076_42880 [Solirubrobacter ginsenosidimutans]|uniref:Uncharacterized protein n=1 Tax=Solirubrobacter ginsenosidimutans TaxID=490573 RepID=A0A9X3SBL0_9ACTN|nr:hypothetical protein [Solirubrobacter ginsenosidimutans]MDA0167083.1 hypothetical protein [Solirubrobacter ginsenosidimutans]